MQWVTAQVLAVALFDNFGRFVASCDFNADGKDDLVVAVPFDEVSSAEDAGSVQVLYGSASGLSVAGDQVFHQDVLTDASRGLRPIRRVTGCG